MRFNFTHIFIISALTILAAATSTSAQVNWWRIENGTAITLELQKIHFDTPDYSQWGSTRDYGLMNLAGFLGARVQVGSNYALLLEIPFASIDLEFTDTYWDWWGGSGDSYSYSGERKKSAFGNPLIGMEHVASGGGFMQRLWIRPPLANENNPYPLYNGIKAALDRFEAFRSKCSSIGFSAGFRSNGSASNVKTQLLFGPMFIFPEGMDAEMYIEASSYLELQTSRFRAGFLFGGHVLVTEDVQDPFTAFTGVVAVLKMPTIEPGVHFRLILDDDLNDEVNYTYGVNLAVKLGPPAADR